MFPDVLSQDVSVCGMSGVVEGGGWRVRGGGGPGLITTLILFSHRPLKLPPLHQVSVWLLGNQGSGVPERHCLFPTNDPPERG